MQRKWIVTLVIAGIIAVGAIAGLIYGISTHTEPGFDEDAAPWDREDIPLKVTCRGYTSDRDSDCAVALDVIEVANSRLGFKALAYEPSPATKTTTVEVIIGVPQNVGDDPTGDGQDDEGNLYHAGENTGLYSVGGKASRCVIRSSNTGSDTMLWLVLYHGFGHCFGLAHDDFELSIMRPVQREMEASKIPPWFTDYDRGLLRERYADAR